MIWIAGDAWRDLTDELSVEAVTIVTSNRTTRLLDLPSRWQARIPLTGGHTMTADHIEQPLTAITFASPCGVVTFTDEHRWHVTTTVIAVLSGLHPDWATTPAAPEAQRLLQETQTQQEHPPHACPVPYCALDISQRASE